MPVQTVLSRVPFTIAAVVRAILALALLAGLPAAAQTMPDATTTRLLWTANSAQPLPTPVQPGTKHQCCACHSHHIAEPASLGCTSAPSRGPSNALTFRIAFARAAPEDRPLRPPIA